MGEKSKKREFPFYVVAIPDEYTILVNGGEAFNKAGLISKLNIDKEKIFVGDKLEVIIPGNEILDPKNNESLGYYDYIKDTLEVIKIHPKFFECAKISYSKSMVNALSPMFGGSGTIEELDVNPDDFLEDLQNSDKDLIRIEDPVRFV
ncbi:hypothetical protein IGK74_001141 [Enterococcus sp. AZ150]|uniref:hypothetical protein n=1 Tax=Enterococcus sp. AZ150 TaxID=2774866 RepID=UPI003F2442B1